MKFFYLLINSFALSFVSSTCNDLDCKFSYYQDKFSDFINKFNKNYVSDDDYEYRFNIFRNNVDYIERHNLNNDDWKMEINQFTDITTSEFKSNYLGLNNFIPSLNTETRKRVLSTSVIDSPKSLDWTTKGVVTAVKNQGQCGSCWAFSTTGALESAYAIKNKKLVSLSEQQLVDCSSSYGDKGCGGGLMDNGFKFAIDNGLCSEDSYQYKAVDGQCSTCTPIVKPSSYVDVTVNNETALLQALLLQPVSVAIEADQSSFQFYSSGVITSSCGKNLDHGVLLVGFGKDSKSGKKFWKIKNSWGSSWGEQGYVRIQKDVSDKAGMCGIALMASYPVF